MRSDVEEFRVKITVNCRVKLILNHSIEIILSISKLCSLLATSVVSRRADTALTFLRCSCLFCLLFSRLSAINLCHFVMSNCFKYARQTGIAFILTRIKLLGALFP